MRNKENTKAVILDAARKILHEQGFEGLKVNALSEYAGVGKPLIYRYFGDMNGVARALCESARLDDLLSPLPSFDVERASSDDVIAHLIKHGRTLGSDRLARDLLKWSLASPAGLIAASESGLPQNRTSSHNITYRKAVYGMLKAAMAYITLARDGHESAVGLPISNIKDMAHLENAMATMIKMVWK